jgi:CRISPR-associated protein Cas2
MSGIRHRVLVCYDVRDPVRLRRTHNAVLGYGDPIQYSVFLCDLSGTEAALMEAALRRVIRATQDSVILVDLGPAEGVARKRIRRLGPSSAATLPPESRRYRVI